MKITRLAVVLMLLSAVAVACSDDDPAAPSNLLEIVDFTGDWEATSAVVTSDAEPDSILDLTLGGIATVTLAVAADSTYEFGQDVLSLSITGTFLITGANTFSLTDDSDPADTLSGTFTLTNNNTVLGVVLPETTIHPNPASIYNPGTLTASFDKQ